VLVLVVLLEDLVHDDLALLVCRYFEEMRTYAVQNTVTLALIAKLNHLGNDEVAGAVIAERNEVVLNLLQHNVNDEVVFRVLNLFLDLLALDCVDQTKVEDALHFARCQVDVLLDQSVLQVDLPLGQAR